METVLYYIRDHLVGTHYFIYAFILLFLMFSIIGYLFKQKYAKYDIKLATSQDETKKRKEKKGIIDKKVIKNIQTAPVENNQVVQQLNQKIITENINASNVISSNNIVKPIGENVVAKLEENSPKPMPNPTLVQTPIPKPMPNQNGTTISPTPLDTVEESTIKPDLSVSIPEIK